MRHILDLLDFSQPDLETLLQDAELIKADLARGNRHMKLPGLVLGLVFEKPSLRTRASFETGMAQLGGSSIFLGGSEAALGVRESIPDFARVLTQYVDVVVLRTFLHESVAEFASYSCCPVINGLSDYYHPCQAFADLFTVKEVFGSLSKKQIVFVGDGNNVARSLAICCAKLGVSFTLSGPEGFGFDPDFVSLFQSHFPRVELREERDPQEAVRQADIIYTDVWTSMGQEAEREDRRDKFTPYQVNESLLAAAPDYAKVMHCLPAHRGEEITDEVLDGPRSIAFQQAANRLHAQKALLLWALERKM